MKKVTIVNYGMGNLHSVRKRMERLNISCQLTADYQDILKAEKLILPGVGHFGQAMDNLRHLQLLDALNEAVLVKNTPVLGICLGMQLMAKHSEEGNVSGLGWFDATVKKFTHTLKIPQMGWNTAAPTQSSPLTQGLPEDAEFYFVHSYIWATPQQSEVIQETNYGYAFPSAIARNHIFAVQYHPEKSHEYGDVILKNFINL
jgi:glutamine amidotransferase